MTTSKVIQFAAGLEREGKPRGIRVGCWPHATRGTQNVVVMEAGPASRLVYITNKSDDPGFWSLNENQLNGLRSSGKEWFAVLLVGRLETGYVLTSLQVEKGTHSWSQNRSDFKVHEGQEISGSFTFDRFSDAFAHLMAGLG